MAGPVVLEAIEPRDREACFAIRIDVFCDEQNVSRDIEFDGLDDQCRHYLVTLDDAEIGTARARPLNDREIKLERIAVRSEFRNTGIGRLLMVRVLSDAARSGYECAVLNSQVQACPFYAKLGFEIEGEPFDEAGIPHRRMRRML